VTDLATRYGAPPARPRRGLVVLVALVIGLLVGWVAWAAVSYSRPQVTSDIVSWKVLDDHTATATFRVSRRTADVEASCLLRARARDHSIVGELNVAVGPGGDRTRKLTESVRTERLATVVEVIGCVAEGQNRRR
jgi:hypothetical protein